MYQFGVVYASVYDGLRKQGAVAADDPVCANAGTPVLRIARRALVPVPPGFVVNRVVREPLDIDIVVGWLEVSDNHQYEAHVVSEMSGKSADPYLNQKYIEYNMCAIIVAG